MHRLAKPLPINAKVALMRLLQEACFRRRTAMHPTMSNVQDLVARRCVRPHRHERLSTVTSASGLVL